MTKKVERFDTGARWAAALRKRYMFAAAKRIAVDFDVNVQTAKSWLAGQAPYAAYYSRAWKLHGIDFIVDALSPNPIEHDDIDRQFDECRKAIAALREYALKGLIDEKDQA